MRNGAYRGFDDKLLIKNEILICQKAKSQDGMFKSRCSECSLNYTKRITNDDVKATMVSCNDVLCSKAEREHFNKGLEYDYDVIFKRKHHIYVEGKPLYAEIGELISVEGKLYKCFEDSKKSRKVCDCDIPDHIKCTKLYCSKAERKRIYNYDEQTHIIFKRYYRNPILRMFKYLFGN